MPYEVKAFVDVFAMCTEYVVAFDDASKDGEEYVDDVYAHHNDAEYRALGKAEFRKKCGNDEAHAYRTDVSSKCEGVAAEIKYSENECRSESNGYERTADKGV